VSTKKCKNSFYKQQIISSFFTRIKKQIKQVKQISIIMYEDIRIAIEVASASICFILVWFMAKPYSLTREGRYLGLPLGFGFLGIGSVVSAIATIMGYFSSQLAWLQLLPRTFAFLFLAVTYFFSREHSRKSHLMWNLSISLLIFVLVTFIISGIINPQLASGDYLASSIYFRFCNLICLSYISIHTLNSHIKTLETSTIVIPFGFILQGISQYSIIIFSVDRSLFAWWGAMALRFASLAVFLFVSYKAFYSMDKQVVRNEEDFTKR
jgi:hypothetical protein